MALIYNYTCKAILQALSAESMSGWRLLEPHEILREGMQQLLPNGEWWLFDWRVERTGSGEELKACDFPHALAYRVRVKR